MAETIAIAVLTWIGVEATATAVAIATIVIGVGVSAGISVLSAAFLTPSAQQQTGAQPSARQFISKSAAGARMRSYGRVRVAGQQVFIGASDGFLYRVTAHNDGKIDGVEEHVIENDVVEVVDNVVVTGKYNDQVRIWWRTGDASQAYYDALEAKFPDWDASHRGDGVAHSLIGFGQVAAEKFSEYYPSGENTAYKQTIRASLVWDPRDPAQIVDDDTTWVWSGNAALVILDFLRHRSGMGMPADWILPDIDAWIEAADVCDQDVALAAGGTVKRYQIWGTYSYDERPADVLGRLLTACNGKLWIGKGGGVALHVGVWTNPTVTIGGDAIVSYKVGSGNEAPDTANTLTAMFLDAGQGYVEAEAQPWVDDDLVTAFGEQRADAKLYMVPSHSQCRRLMKQAFGRLAPEWKGTITTNKTAMVALTERYVNIDIDDLDLSIVAEIDDVKFRIERGNVVTGLIIEFTSVDPAIFDFDAETEEGQPSEVPPPIDAAPIAPPTGVEILIVPRGPVAVAAIEWDAPPVDTLETEVQFRVDGPNDWMSVMASAGSSSIETPTLIDGEIYAFRVRHVGQRRSSDWTDEITKAVVIDDVPPGVVTDISMSSASGGVNWSWHQPNSANVVAARIYRSVDIAATFETAVIIDTIYGGPSVTLSGFGETFESASTHWWIVAINASGIEGTAVFAGTINP